MRETCTFCNATTDVSLVDMSRDFRNPDKFTYICPECGHVSKVRNKNEFVDTMFLKKQFEPKEQSFKKMQSKQLAPIEIKEDYFTSKDVIPSFPFLDVLKTIEEGHEKEYETHKEELKAVDEMEKVQKKRKKYTFGSDLIKCPHLSTAVNSSRITYCTTCGKNLGRPNLFVDDENALISNMFKQDEKMEKKKKSRGRQRLNPFEYEEPEFDTEMDRQIDDIFRLEGKTSETRNVGRPEKTELEYREKKKEFTPEQGIKWLEAPSEELEYPPMEIKEKMEPEPEEYQKDLAESITDEDEILNDIFAQRKRGRTLKNNPFEYMGDNSLIMPFSEE